MSQQLQRTLGLTALTLITVGASIGSGIFMSPSVIADYLRDPTKILLIWTLGGLIALSGALTLAEMGSMYPKAGGVYVYIREAFGDMAAFLFGWVILTVSNTGCIAAMVITFSKYMGIIVPIGQQGEMWLSVAAIVVVTAINLVGVRAGGAMASLFTALKLMGLLVIILVGILMANIPVLENIATKQSMEAADRSPIATFGLALIGILWAYGGWHYAATLGGETRNPSRTLPLAMILGTIVITVIFVLTNVAYMQLLPIDQLAESTALAADAMNTKFSWGGKFVAALIAVSTLGSASIFCMSGPRIYFAMAKDGLFFKEMATLHPKYQVPVNAILVQSAWTIVLLLFWGTFSDLITYVGFIDYLFFGLAAVGLLVLRRTKPQVARPYRTWGYPIVPLFFIAIIGWFVFNTLIEKPTQALAGLCIMLVGLPLYFVLKRRHKVVNKYGE